MKPLSLFAVIGATFCLTSCGLFQSAVQLPIRTLQSVGRGIGVGLEHSEEQVEKASGEEGEKVPDFRAE